MREEVFQYLQMHLRVADNTLFPHLFPSCLELRLDEARHLAALPQQAIQRREDQLQRDEAHVDGGKIQLLRYLLPRQVPRVGTLQTHHAPVAAQLPVQLSVAHIHRVDLRCAVLQHAVREASGGRADIGADLALQRNGKRLHGLFQLQSAPAHIPQRVTTHLHAGVLRHRRTGLVRPLAVHKHQPRHNGSLCLLAALTESALCQEHVQSRFFAHLSTSRTACAMPSASSPSTCRSCAVLPCAGSASPAFRSAYLSIPAPRSNSSAPNRSPTAPARS